MKHPTMRIGGGVCPECGGCDWYCADCTFPLLVALRAVAGAARAVMAAIDPFKVDDNEARLQAALDVLDAGGPTAKLYVDGGGAEGSERTDGVLDREKDKT